ncbi:MAG: UDP-N-acetylglucosamine 2-epimerase (non-hydrolyzing) [Candidatus Margulisbacteria bacterium]|jgi:UDP-N-acetylglucosamine 2-epimerase (non-hydrolysing)|nr:UDP-N-acetylglucosamine 2-epimerase (non-hydrolyzing) [Candidatus Margulisiibacteriota bacterium]
MKHKKFLFILGTRPEAIKLAPLIRLVAQTANFEPLVCATGQHREMLAQALRFFQIRPQFNLRIMRRKQTLSGLTARLLSKLDRVINKSSPDCIVAQGDTTSALAGALAGYYHKIPVAHVEAGLRSGDKRAPYPEELNRVLISRLADCHFAPTLAAAANLKREGITKNIFVTGNTVTDALFLGLEKIRENPGIYEKYFSFLDRDKKIILVTGHRRESFGRQFENICAALKDLAERNRDVQIVYPAHLNPQVQEPVFKILKNMPNIYLLKPLAYPYLLWLLEKCYFVLTDSGGIQEEAPSLGKPVLVLRKVTERLEGIKAGNAVLVGTERKNIVRQAEKLLTEPKIYKKMASAKNPYGDGRAALRIIRCFRKKCLTWS